MHVHVQTQSKSRTCARTHTSGLYCCGAWFCVRVYAINARTTVYTYRVRKTNAISCMHREVNDLPRLSDFSGFLFVAGRIEQGHRVWEVDTR